MDARKGMSQTLALIVAASVLMMTALTVIFLAQGGLGSLGEQSSTQSCRNAIQAKCRAALAGAPESGAGTVSRTVDVPGACLSSGQEAQGGTEISGAEVSNAQNVDDSSEPFTIECVKQ